jgi:hypothetical protein
MPQKPLTAPPHVWYGGHNPATGAAVLAWLADRFARKPAPNDCNSE